MKEEDYITGLSTKVETKMTTCNSLNIINDKSIWLANEKN